MSGVASLILDDTAGDNSIQVETKYLEGENTLNALIRWLYEQAMEIIGNGETYLGNPGDDTEIATLSLSMKSSGMMGISCDFGERGCFDEGPNSISKQVAALLLERLVDKLGKANGEDA